MARAAKLALALLLSQDARGLRRREEQCVDQSDSVTYADFVYKTCNINWALRGTAPNTWEDTQHSGCWDMIEYNTDKFFSSILWQSKVDGRCALSFSGYHGALAGYVRGAAALVLPPAVWDVCGLEAFAPYVRLIRHHFALSNWSKIVRKMGGSEAVCSGDVAFAAESMGGSAGEVMAYCANTGRQSELMASDLPQFKVSSLYTFGSPASAVKPIPNPLRKDGCWPGKRIFIARDPVAHIGAMFNLTHPRMDAVKIFTSRTGNPSIQSHACGSDGSAMDILNDAAPPPVVAKHPTTALREDAIGHEITTYKAISNWMEEQGQGHIFKSDPWADSEAHKQGSTASTYLALMQKGTLPAH